MRKRGRVELLLDGAGDGHGVVGVAGAAGGIGHAWTSSSGCQGAVYPQRLRAEGLLYGDLEREGLVRAVLSLIFMAASPFWQGFYVDVS